MLLVETTIDSTLHRVSMEGIALEHYWDNRIIAFDPPQYQIAFPYGGYVRPGFGGISFSHHLFEEHWPPPAQCLLSVYYTAAGEAEKELLFEGAAHLRAVTREQVDYELFGPAFDATVPDATAFDDTLVNVASWFCDASRLNLTLDSTYARSPSPAVKFTRQGDAMALDLLSNVCAFFTHLFHIKGSVLYLADMLADAGSESITEFDFFPSAYHLDVPVALARTTPGNHVRTSAYPYGRELSFGAEYHDTAANIEDALDDVISVSNKVRCSLRMPLLGGLPDPGRKVSWTDASLGRDTAAYIRCRTVRYDFGNEEIVIEGEGEVSAL